MNDMDRSRKNLNQAGTVALWVWVALAVAPILGCMGCCLFGIVGSATRTR
jgi:hypothetical protein